jgi:hypothetical protein
VLRKAPPLPITFRGSGVAGNFGGCGGLDSVGGRVTGVIGYVGRCGGVTSGACGSLGCRIIGVAGGGMTPLIIARNFRAIARISGG